MADNNMHMTPAPDPAGETGAQATQSRTVDAGRGWNWITEGFDLFKKQPGMWILLILGAGLITIVLALIPVLGSLATVLLFPLLGGGFMLGCRALEQDGQLEIDHLFAGFKQNTGSLVVLGAINLAVSVAIVLVMIAIIGTGAVFALMKGDAAGTDASIVSIALAALLAVGISVPLYMAVWFAPALVVLDGAAPIEALKASFFACLKNMLPFTVYGIVLMIFCIIAMIPLGLGFLLLGPVIIASIYTSYRDIFSAA